MDDWLRGDAHERPGKEHMIRTLRVLQHVAWQGLATLDAALTPIVDYIVSHPHVKFVFMSDHPLSLYEHGVRCEAPWEGCLRTFVHSPTASHASGKTPTSTNVFLSLVFELLGLPDGAVACAAVSAGFVCYSVSEPIHPVSRAARASCGRAHDAVFSVSRRRLCVRSRVLCGALVVSGGYDPGNDAHGVDVGL